MMKGLLVTLLLLLLFVSYRHFLLLNRIKKLNRDIAEKKRKETSLLLTTSIQNKELEKLIAQINELFNDLQEIKNLSIKEKQLLDIAIHNITHDIRTPLTVASGFTQQLLRQENDPLLQNIRSNLQLVSQRLEVLLEYQNLIEGSVQPELQPLSFSQRIKETLLNYYEALTEKNFEVTTALEEPLTVLGDPDIMERILQNIFSNVLKHGKESLSVNLTSENKYAILTVTNTCQQPIENIEKLTTRFYSENLSETEESSGLGLYITKELVELLNGLLTIETVDQRFALSVYLPKNKEVEE